MTGSWFDCHEAQPCTIDASAIANSAAEACAGGHVVPSGSRCEPACEAGYQPVLDDGVELKCKDGFLDTPTASSPAFACARVTTTATTTTAAPPTSLTTTKTA